MILERLRDRWRRWQVAGKTGDSWEMDTHVWVNVQILEGFDQKFASYRLIFGSESWVLFRVEYFFLGGGKGGGGREDIGNKGNCRRA